jgi:predicted amino acid racemase
VTAPRLDIDLDKIHHNAHTLVTRLAGQGIAVTGVTKAALGSPDIAGALLRAGVAGLGDSRIENIETMRRAGLTAPMALIRSPMVSQVDRVVRHADVSFNTEPVVIGALADAARAAGRTHGIVLMVELGDLREGLMPGDVVEVARRTRDDPDLELRGLGANLACQSGVVPDARNMAELSVVVAAVEAALGHRLAVVSGGNSGNLDWALSGADVGRVDDLRLGEAILLGREPLHRRPLDGLHTDAVTLVAEVIEARDKPVLPWGDVAQTAFGARTPAPADRDRGLVARHVPGSFRRRTIVAVGEQDTDPSGLRPPPGVHVLGASSDHLLLDTGDHPAAVGAEIVFQLGYGALVRAMTSPYVEQRLVEAPTAAAPAPLSHGRSR